MFSFDARQVSKRFFVFAIITFAWSCANADGSTTAFQTFQPLIFKAKSSGDYTAQSGNVIFTLKNPDDAKHPQIWDSALSIAHTPSSHTCATDPLLVQRVYVSSQGAVLVVHLSGSTTFVDVFDTAACKPRSPRIEAMTEKVTVEKTRVEIWPGCESIDAVISNCSAASVFQIDAHFAQSELPDVADALTRQVVGVSFKGIKKVRHAKTGKATLVN